LLIQIFQFPEIKEVFVFYSLHIGHKFINDSKGLLGDDQNDFDQLIEEISICSLGADQQRANTYMMLRTDKNDLMIYRIAQTIEYVVGDAIDRLAIQFIKIDHDYISRDLQQYQDSGGDKINPVTTGGSRKYLKKRAMKPFDQIGASYQQLYSGIFVAGPRPVWIMMGCSGGRDCANFVVTEDGSGNYLPSAPVNSSNTLRVHPMSVDGPVMTFAPIHNPSIPFGFAYVNSKV
jgi:hypothetical protein